MPDPTRPSHGLLLCATSYPAEAVMLRDAHEITNTGERHPNGERAMADHPLRAVALELNEPIRL